MASRVEMKKFNKIIENIVIGFGGTPIESPFPFSTDESKSWTLETRVGELQISVHAPESSKLFSVFCRFEDVDKAKTFIGDDNRLNKYSGKFNFHYSDREGMLTVFENTLEKLKL